MRTAMDYPANLGEGKHLLTPENELQLLLGQCLAARGRRRPRPGSGGRGPPSPRVTPTHPPADGPYWQALALRELGESRQPTRDWRSSSGAARQQTRAEVRIPYFATSLPTLLLFDDDLTALAHVEARYLEGLALLGMGRLRAAGTRFADVLAARPEHLEAALRFAEIGRGLSSQSARAPRGCVTCSRTMCRSDQSCGSGTGALPPSCPESWREAASSGPRSCSR